MRCENSKTCSVRCQRAWLGKKKIGTKYKMDTDKKRKYTPFPYTIVSSKTKKKYIVPEAAPKTTFKEFQERLAAAAQRRRIVY